MSKKDVSMFSADELALLNQFVKQAAIEDKKLHGITGNTSTKKPAASFYNQDKAKTTATSTNTNINKSNPFLNQKKEEKKPPTQTIKSEPIKTTTAYKPPTKKEEP